MRVFLRDNKLLVTVFVAATLVTAWFAFQVIADAIYFNDPRHQDEALKNWMTPRYIGQSYDLPRPVVLEILELSEEGPQRQRLGEIADDLGLTLPELTARVRDAAETYRSQQQ